MSSLVLMRILESVPARYDRGMQVLTLGGWRRGHQWDKGVQRAIDRVAKGAGGAVDRCGVYLSHLVLYLT